MCVYSGRTGLIHSWSSTWAGCAVYVEDCVVVLGSSGESSSPSHGSVSVLGFSLETGTVFV